jgi:hypothetical protein
MEKGIISFPVREDPLTTDEIVLAKLWTWIAAAVEFLHSKWIRLGGLLRGNLLSILRT